MDIIEKQKIELLALLKKMGLFVSYGSVTFEIVAGIIKFIEIKDRRKLS